MSTKIPIFFLGATGYIGGSVLHRLLTHRDANTFDITVLVRSPEKANKLEAFGVKCVVGSFTDYALTERLAEEAHVVFSCADCNDNSAAQSIVRGLKKRHDTLKDVPILIHTSVTAEFTSLEDTKGMVSSNLIYDDSNVEQMKAIPPEAFHRNVTLTYVQADQEGYIKTHIILPGTIYGTASTPFVDIGIQNSHSPAMPVIFGPSLERGRAGVVGKGLAVWSNVHNDDVADLFIVLWDAIHTDPAGVGHGWHGFYIAENGECSMYEVASEIGRAMVSRGLSSSEEPTAYSEEELKKMHPVMAHILGADARGRATHSRSIGWKPRYTKEDMLKSLKEELEVLSGPRTEDRAVLATQS